MGISSYNKSMNNLSNVHSIFAQLSSIGAACRTKLKKLNEIPKIHSGRRPFEKKRPNGDFKPKNPVE
jgi:hypothetical protein